MRNSKPGAEGNGGNHITGSILSGNVQIAGDVEGGMSMVVGAPPSDNLEAALAALRQVESALSAYQGQEAEQGLAAVGIIEGEITAESPERSRVRRAFTKLQEIALTFGGTAAAVNNVGKLLNLLGF
jgi:hypothetical protein